MSIGENHHPRNIYPNQKKNWTESKLAHTPSHHLIFDQEWAKKKKKKKGTIRIQEQEENIADLCNSNSLFWNQASSSGTERREKEYLVLVPARESQPI